LRADALDREAAVAEERALLARNLHDSIAQSLAFLKIQVQLLRTAVQKGQTSQMQGALDELDIGLRESIGDVRELLVHFRTRTNTDDIEQALQETLQKFQSQTGLSGQLQVHGQGLPLPSDVQVQVLHVVQEALSNVRKHAGAAQVGLEVVKGARWRFVVRDNGAGFDTQKHPGESHVGLNIMRERAGRIGAEVNVVSTAGQGTTVTLTLPPHPEVSGGMAAQPMGPAPAAALRAAAQGTHNEIH
jgi:two-component system nitrate/nitrite sensor histidine kinase NarX